MTSIFDPLPLAHGGNLQNRLAKAAMEEHLAGPGQAEPAARRRTEAGDPNRQGHQSRP